MRDIMHDIMLDIMHDIINDIPHDIGDTHDIIYIDHDNDDIYTYTCIHSPGLCLIQDCWIRRIAPADISDDDDDMDSGTPDQQMMQILGMVATGSVSQLYPGA